MRKGDRSILANGVSLVVCGLLAGVVVAAAAFPAVALTGLAAKAGADNFDSLPSTLQVPQAPQVTNVYASDGKTLITSLFDENRRNVPIDQISQVMQDAVVASEDKRFFIHNGVDVRGIARAFVADQNNQGQQGASTLTMQYVRLATSYSATTPQQVLDATEETPARKIREAHLAIALEKQLTEQHGGDKHAAKLDILDRYLNIAPFGHGAYGIYAAAEVYYNEPPKALTVAQAALIAGLLQGTTEFDPTTKQGLKNAVDRRNNHVLPEMLSMHFISQAQYDTALKARAALNLHPTPNGCISAKASYGFFCDYLYRWWLDQPAFGADTFERENQLETGGYKIVTTLNVKDQAAAVKHIQAYDKTGKSSAMMIAGVEPATGDVSVVAVNRNYNNDETRNGKDTNPKAPKGSLGSYPNTTIPLVTGSPDNLGYQFGSTFKMFTMLAALESGLPLSYKINTTYQYKSNFPDAGDPNACGGYYCPTNASKNEKGPYNMWTGYGHSVNTYFVPLEDRIGTAGPIDVARRLGITIPASLHINPATFGAFTLGVIPVTPLQMASAYGTVANNGVYCKPLPVKSITDSSGHQLDIAKPQCIQAIQPDIAHLALDAARCPVGNQSQVGNNCNGATAPDVANQVGRPVAGKTGTTDNNQTYSLIAMTPQMAIAGVVADPDYATNSQTLPRRSVNTVVALTLRDSLKGLPKVGFPAPDPSLAFGKVVSIPDVTCDSFSSARSQLENAGFRVVPQQSEIPSACKQGTVAKTDPSGSTVKGGPVAVYLSNGQAPAPTPGQSTPPGRGGGGGPGGGGGGGGPLPPVPPGGH
jgi:membrane peptidoglycan carboxypeptidase